MEPQSTTQTVAAGDKAQLSLSSGDHAAIKAKCQKLGATLALIALVYKGDLLHFSNVEEMGIGLYVTTLWVAVKNLKCDELLREDSAKSSKTYLGKVAESGGVPTGPTSSSTGAVEIEIGLQQGPLHAEVVNDQVSLNVDTPTATVSSDGRNDFGVGYDPNSGTSFVAAYQNPLHIKPSNSNQTPFTLDSGQQVEVNSNGIGMIRTVVQTTGGSTYVSPNGKDMYGPEGGTANTQPSGMAQDHIPIYRHLVHGRTIQCWYALWY